VFLHLGVAVDAASAKLETAAYNNATFRCSDVAGWQPAVECIDRCAALDAPLRTSLDVAGLLAHLRAEAFSVEASTDPGRFVCNWTYYCSLRMCESSRVLVAPSVCAHSLFLHVPPVEVSPIEAQLRLLVALMHTVVASLTVKVAPV